jgi:hypothetical protein
MLAFAADDCTLDLIKGRIDIIEDMGYPIQTAARAIQRVIEDRGSSIQSAANATQRYAHWIVSGGISVQDMSSYKLISPPHDTHRRFFQI